MGYSLRALLALAAAVAFTDSSVTPTGTGQVNNHRQWKRGNRLDPDAIIPLRIGLVQSNVHLGYEKLMEVSDPSSESFGKHLSEDEVHDLFAPARETFDAVHSWLVESGVNATDIRQYVNKGWLAIDLPVSHVEDLFLTQYHEHEREGVLKVGCDQYHVPKHLAKHIDYIVPGVKLSPPMVKRSLERRSGTNHRKADLQDCARNFTAICYRALYQIPATSIPVPGHEPAVYESGDTFSQEDIDSYFHKYAPYIPKGTHPKILSIDGGQAPVAPDSEFNTGESDIDIDIIQTLIWPQSMVLYQVDDPFGITGDSPGVDPSYPDNRPGGYKGQRLCGAYKPNKVISISYGEGEIDVPKNYFLRQCNEWLKLGLQGTTVLVSSGDYGAAMPPHEDSASGCLSGSGQNQTIYNPGNPVSCPYLTAVGAMQTNLGPGAELFASGGGFSNYFPVPDYQKAAVKSYFAKHDPGHPYYIANSDASNIGEHGGIYNRAGRGIPDISANGAHFRAFNNQTDGHWFGTSLAAPLWASVITLINQERAKIGKGSVGFINPVLYANTDALTDIKQGSNPNCGTSGFTAVEGWDPVTGLGTPKYPNLLKLWLKLP
ncbi:pro-kumamolisin, activation domain-containing protein [Trichoderma breve]|uniref:tripeptidyl-peptidase II n=1 Tax=Trichoderma breve TaxID=2034170 RepID=A0A9W9B5J1_9HYPO|nr:pro-kumamolisin, activation domain-containing protein [Trichoderma breve]KAJ4856853.1 pro-kumamolisin, activation domain-containing protein [Trichoderma breve]